jgi:hypothetical protein
MGCENEADFRAATTGRNAASSLICEERLRVDGKSCELPTLDGWERKTTTDGRIYFVSPYWENVAYNPDGEFERSTKHPGFDKLTPKTPAIFWPVGQWMT